MYHYTSAHRAISISYSITLLCSSSAVPFSITATLDAPLTLYRIFITGATSTAADKSNSKPNTRSAASRYWHADVSVGTCSGWPEVWRSFRY